jgi:pyruvyltransferase
MKLYQYVILALLPFSSGVAESLPLYFWSPESSHVENFGDYISLKLVERIVQHPVEEVHALQRGSRKKLLAVGSILHFAENFDVIWGSGINGKHLEPTDYHFSDLDVRAVRGPLTREFLMKHWGVSCPEVYGDPALLLPYFFPEFKRKKNPSKEYIIIPHISEEPLFPITIYPNVIYPTERWDFIIEQILDSKLVIASSLHGLIIAEAFGVPARLLRITENEPLFKYEDYYLGTNRESFQFATTIEEALQLGGEPPHRADLRKLYAAFPLSTSTL